MANWAWTQYVIEGTPDTLDKIEYAIKHPDIEEGSSENWEGNVLRALNIIWERRNSAGTGKYMRGFIEQTWWEDDEHTVLRFDAHEAWGVTDFNDVIEEHFSDIKVYWYCEEPGMGYYVTNDAEGKYFQDKYYADVCINGEYYSDYFIEEEALWKWLSEHSDGKITNQKEVDDFNEKVDGDPDDFINIFEIGVVK